ncbi:MAG TPA: sialidase family protein [Thermoplasmata archaeon]|nr:sialidase family protein [Thermoplasmata archaeon]
MKGFSFVLIVLVVASALMVPQATARASTDSAVPLVRPDAHPASVVPFLPNIRITDGSSPFAWQVEPTMAINRSGTIFAGWKETDGPEAAGIRVGSSYSTDQGQTWAPNILQNQSHPNRGCHNSDPWMALGPDDRVHYAYLEYDCGSYFNVQNTTTGNDWGTVHTVVGNGGLVDKDAMWVDPSNRIYAIWDEGNVLAVTWSDNGGATWKKPFVNPQDSPSSNVLGTVIETAANGTVYVVWWDFSRSNIYFDWSSDRGTTWHTDKRVNDRDGSASGGGWQLSIPAMNVDQNSGAIYVAWPDVRNGNLDIYMSGSTDGGLTWSANNRINDDSDSTTQYMVDLAIDSHGTVHAAWEDERSGAWNIYYSNSTDGGATWAANLRVSSEDTSGSYNRPGDYFAIEAGPNDYIYVIWTDGRGDDFDIYYARSPGFPVATVTVGTDPTGLPVTVDGVTAASPKTFNWTIGSTHSISVSSTIPIGPGSRYLWLSWSDGGAMTHEITADADLILTARFVKQYQISVGASPGNRTVLVDNVSIAARTMFWWDDGVPHWLEAPPQPDDTPDARYEWQSWSDGKARAHSVAATAPLSLTATFVREATLRITTSPEGLDFYLDDIEYNSSQTFWFELGSSHFAFVPPSQSAPGARYTFVNWSDGGSFGHPIQFSGAMSLEASFRAEFYLTVTTPFGEASGGGWYDNGTIAFASLSRTSVPGATGVRYAFVGWTGGASGAGAVSSGILMDGPKVATADWSTEYEVTVVSDVGTIEGSGWYAAGATVTLQAPAQVTQGGTTYDFAGWTGDAVSEQPTLTLTVHSPMTVHATYTATGPLGVSTTGWGLLVVVIIAIALLVPILLWRRRKGRDEG